MNTASNFRMTSVPVQLAGVALALLATASQLHGVDLLAQHRLVSRTAQIVELPRVVVTGQRLAASLPEKGVTSGVVAGKS